MPTIASSLLLIALVSLAPFAWFYAQNLHEPIEAWDVAGYGLIVAAIACALFVCLRAALRPTTARLAVATASGVVIFFNYFGAAEALASAGVPATLVLSGWGILAATIWSVAIYLGRWPVIHQFLLVFAAWFILQLRLDNDKHYGA